MCRKIDRLKWLRRNVWPLLLLLLGGCATDIRSPLVNLDMALTSPLLEAEQQVPVVYPYAEERREAGGGPLAETYGPAWRDLHGLYPEYHFN